MFDALFPLRMAQTASDLLLQNLSQGVGLWADAATRSMAPFMATASAGAPSSQARVRSWYRHPDEPTMPWDVFKPAWAGLTPNLFRLPAMPALGRSHAMAGPFGSADTFLLWQSWQRLMPVPAAMRAWPLACFFIGIGMPSGAAWPAAEASTHMLDATLMAAEGVQEIFSSYRSDGGHATSQIIRPGRLH